MKNYTLILLIFLFLGCSNSQKTKNQTLKVRVDSISFRLAGNSLIKEINGKAVENYTLSEAMKNELKDFPRVINNHINTVYNFLDSAIITDEGTFNQYKTSITETDKGSLIVHEILQGKTIIWKDTLVVNENVSYYWQDSIFDKLKPYSYFFIAYKYFRNFVDETYINSSVVSSYGNEATIFYSNNTDSNYWNKELKNFKGRLISNLSIEDQGWFIWDKRYKKFSEYENP